MKDRYLVERELGEGGAATVYLARDIKHDRNVAIKVFRPELAETLGAERFNREIRTAANLNHPHILTVLDSGTADGLLYYVMPFAEGESLRARITREGGLPIADVIRILREVADALSAAHAAGVVHRDIKPDNVLLSGRHAMVADFGVAKAISESTGKNAITTLGVALGTPAYMAPEQAAADPHVDHRADIYALGILGYEMLTGEPPFVRRTPQEVLAAHVTEAAPSVSVRRQSVPPALDAMIAKCLVKQPADRYQSAEDILAELERISTPTAGMSPAAGIEPTSARPAVSRAKIPLGVAAGVIGVLAIVGTSWFAVTKFSRSSTDANVVAVFPFEVSGPSDLQYLREGLVSVMEAHLTGEGGPRGVPAQTMIAQWKRHGGEKQGMTDDEAREIAGAVGAGRFIRGTIVSAGAEIVVSATLTRPSGAPVQAQVKGSAESIAVIAAQLAGQLLSLNSGQSAERAARLTRVPPAALRAYLEGQAAYRVAAYPTAITALEKALNIDSTFALAAMALANARGMNPTTFATGGGSELGLALRHRDQLAPRDLILLQLQTPGQFAGRPLSMRETLALSERLAREVPDRTEAWYLLGDRYMHYGEAAGFTRTESVARALQAFSEALRLDPGIAYIKQHIADMAMWNGDDAMYRRVVDSLRVSLPAHRLGVAILAGDSAAARRIVAAAGASLDDLLSLSVSAWMTGAPRLADSLMEAAVSRGANVGERRATLRWARWFADMAGRPKMAARMQGLLRAVEDNAGQPFPEEDLYLAVFGGGDTVAAVRAASSFKAEANHRGRASPNAVGHAAWMLGVWAGFRSDTAGVSAALRQLDELGTIGDTTGVASRNRLRADVLRLMRGGGIPSLQAVVRVDSVLAQGPAIPSIVRASMNVIVAQAWERLGDVGRAATAIRRVGMIDPTFSSVTIHAQREKGRLLLAAGDTSEALRAWAYLRARTLAEPAQKKADDEIRATIAEIQRKKR